MKRMSSQSRSIVRDYKGNQITSITLIFGHVKTTLKTALFIEMAEGEVGT